MSGYTRDQKFHDDRRAKSGPFYFFSAIIPIRISIWSIQNVASDLSTIQIDEDIVALHQGNLGQ